MRHIACCDIISFPVIDADRDFVLAGSQVFCQVVQVRIMCAILFFVPVWLILLMEATRLT